MSTQPPPDLFAAAEAYRLAQAEVLALQDTTGRTVEWVAAVNRQDEAGILLRHAARTPPEQRVRTADIFSPITGTFAPATVPELPRVARFEALSGDRIAVTVEDYNAAKAGSASFRDGVLALYEVIRTQVHGDLATQLARTVAQVMKGGDQ